MNKKRKSKIIGELKHHSPFTLAASLLAGVLVVILYLINKEYFVGTIPALFEIMHPAHVLISAMATSAIYWKYNKSIIKTILVGISGAIFIGSFSDVIFPWIAGNLFSLHTHFHLPIIENPILIISVAFIGSIIGMSFGIFRLSHSLHVFLSIFASLFYLLTFSIEMNFLAILLVSFLVFLAVYLPCCISDIVFPLLFIKKSCKNPSCLKD